MPLAVTTAAMTVQWDQAVAFTSGFNNTELLQRYNEVLVSLREPGEIESLVEKQVKRPMVSCKTSDVQTPGSQLTFEKARWPSGVPGRLWVPRASSPGDRHASWHRLQRHTSDFS